MWLMAAASITIFLAIFGTGMFVGQWMGARSAEKILLAVREQDNTRLAQHVQEAGSAYVTALAALEKLHAGTGQITDASNPASQTAWEIQQGREAALGALYGATIELARITPGDPHITQLLRILEDRRFKPAEVRRAKPTMWF